jgi:hypothetical protein
MDGAPDRGDSDPSKLKFHYGSIGIVLEINAGRKIGWGVHHPHDFQWRVILMSIGRQYAVGRC